MSFVRDVLTGSVSVDLRRDQRSVYDVLVEKWEVRESREDLEAGFRELIFDPDPRLKSAAVEFFTGRNADDNGLMLIALRDSSEEFRDVQRHWYSGETTLLCLLLMSAAQQVTLDSSTIAIFRKEVFDPACKTYALQGLMKHDTSWLLDNLIDIVKDDTEVLRATLYAARMFGTLPDEFILKLASSMDNNVLVEILGSVFPSDIPRISWLLESAREDEEMLSIKESLTFPSASERMDGVKRSAGILSLVPVLSRFYKSALEGCTNLNGCIPDGLSESRARRVCKASIRKEVIESLKETGNTDAGLHSLFQTAGIYPDDGGEGAALALRKMNPDPVAEFARRMLKGRRTDTVNIGCGIASVAMYFDGSMKAVGSFLENGPKPLPEFLDILRRTEMELLKTLANGSDPLALKMKDLLKVMNTY